MRKEEPLNKIEQSKGFTYHVTFDNTDTVNLGDYIYDFELKKTDHSEPIIRCDSERMVQLVRLDHKKERAHRRSAKITATDDPILTMNGVKELKLS